MKRELQEREWLYNINDLMGYLTIKFNKYFWYKKNGKKVWEDDDRVNWCWDYKLINKCAKYLLDNPNTIDKVLAQSERPEILYYIKTFLPFAAILKSKTYIISCLAANIKATNPDAKVDTYKDVFSFYANLGNKTELVEPKAVLKLLKFFVLSDRLIKYEDQELELMAPDENRWNKDISEEDDDTGYHRKRWDMFKAFMIVGKVDDIWEHISEAEYKYIKNSSLYKAYNDPSFEDYDVYINEEFLISGEHIGRSSFLNFKLWFPKSYVDEIKNLNVIDTNYEMTSRRAYRNTPEYFAPQKIYRGWDNCEFSMDIHGEND